MAGSVSAGGGGVSVSGVPGPLLLARRFRCGLGRSHSGRGRFGPLRSLSPSMPGSSWLWREVSSTSSLSFPAPQCPCSWTILLLWLTCASNGALAHWLSTLLRSGFSVGRSLFALFSLPNSSWGGTMFSRTPCPTQSDPWLGVDSEVGGLLGAPQEVPGDDRPFATLSNHRCSLYFSPFNNPSALGMDVLLQNWDGLQVYAFPPWALIPLVLNGHGFPIFWSLWWTVQLCCLSVQIYSVSLISIVIISGSTGCRFMPSDCPALRQGRGLLFASSDSGRLRSQALLAHELPSEVVCLSAVMPHGWAFHIPSDSSEDCGFSVLAPLLQEAVSLLHPGISLHVVLGVSL